MALHETIADGVATVVMDNPPVNALGIADTYALADLLDGYGNQADVRSVILPAEGHGFCAGVTSRKFRPCRATRASWAPTAPVSGFFGPSTSAWCPWGQP